MRSVAAVVLALSGVLAAACGGGDGAGDRAPAGGGADGSTADLRATLQRSTLFETRRSLLLTVRHGGNGDGDDDPVVRTIQLETPLFEVEPPEERDARVRAGGRGVAMPLPFGTARCDRDASDAAGAAATLVAEIDGDEVRVPIEQSPTNLLAALNASECAAAAVLADVELHFGEAWEHTAERTVEGDLELTQRRAGAVASVDGVRGNVIFTVRAGGDAPVAEVDDLRPTATAGVAVTASRCDPHALIEYKRTFVFTASVRVDGGDAVEVDVPAEGQARQVLEDLLTACIG